MNLSEVNHDPNTLALARRLSKPIIIFDLEHTGSAGEHRCITDFGAILVTPDGDISTLRVTGEATQRHAVQPNCLSAYWDIPAHRRGCVWLGERAS
ncbi:hypothetical protein LJR029_007113 [Caballeronia sp. LjRoot29]|uniref:hypothetical protein n=1 Tax=Caballeronia sp. LjRoot29 TaxID=3342315 RepID=UPI003ECDA9A5